MKCEWRVFNMLKRIFSAVFSIVETRCVVPNGIRIFLVFSSMILSDLKKETKETKQENQSFSDRLEVRRGLQPPDDGLSIWMGGGSRRL